ncbi:MAG TPA: carboxypeptidase regulatory-like domain-containing protein [Cytophagales bacterium]|nr:carboxypeptidase regulatory-like domain-containing protein [Cytophagales bacterium]
MLIFFLTVANIFAQKRTLKQAEINYKAGYYFKALQLYTEVLAQNPDNHDARYKECICQYQLSRFEDAQSCFQYLLAHTDKYPISLNYFLAKTFRSENDLDSAVFYFSKYIVLLEKTSPNSKAMKDAIKEYEATVKAKEQIAKESKVEVHSLGPKINTKYPDYAPLLTADEKTLIFTSCRPETKGGIIEDNDGRYHEDIYISYYNDSLKEWSQGKQIDQINTGSNDAAVFLSPDGQRMIIYRHDPYNHLDQNAGDLYMTELKDGIWSEPASIAEINSEYWESSATMSEDEKVLVFASNRPSGFGGQDLYISRKDDTGKWSIPINLARINTPYDEDSPFLHSDGKTLYFSSKGFSGIGGYDVFYTVFDLEKNTWSTPVHLPFPISTPNDDLYISWNISGRTAYISTLWHGGAGDKDIYRVEFPRDQTKIVLVHGTVKDSSQVVKEAKVVVRNLDTKLVEVYNSDDDGAFKLILEENGKYIIEVNKEGYLPFTQFIDLKLKSQYQKIENETILLHKQK